jgi:hypothetical protein
MLSPIFPFDDTPLFPSCPAWSQINQLSILLQPIPSPNQQGNKSPKTLSGTCYSTSTMVQSSKHTSATILYLQGGARITGKDHLMQLGFQQNSYNVNALVNYKLVIVIKQKPKTRVEMHRGLPCSRMKLVWRLWTTNTSWTGSSCL